MPEEINNAQNLDLKPKNNLNIFNDNIETTKKDSEKINNNIQNENVNTGASIDQLELKTIETTEDNSAKTNKTTADFDIEKKETTQATTTQNNKDKELEDKIDKIIMSDGVNDLYELMSTEERQEFENKKKESSLKIIVAVKSANHNIKKAINKIFKIIYEFIKSLKKIDNKAYIEKISKIKVDRIIRENEDVK